MYTFNTLGKDAFNWSKVTLTLLQKISISLKCCSFQLSFHQRIQKNAFHKYIKQQTRFQNW